ncbi:MAG: XRE family transcriptional regulator [Planctomycetota bacterium]
MPLGDRLRFARERSGLTQSEVSLRTEVGESSLSEFESGRREPSLGQLETLAKAYHRPWTWFVESTPVESAPLVLWRHKPTSGASEVEAHFLELCHAFRRLEILEKEPEGPGLLMVLRKADKWTYSDAIDLARRVRNSLALGDRPGPSLLRVLEEVWKLKIFHLDFEPEGTAASHFSDEIGGSILLNRRSVRWRRNHDLAHELFHLLTWKAFHCDGQAPTEDEWRHEEKLATSFAAALLLPEEPFRAAIAEHSHGGRIDVDALHDVARSFDVSVESAIWRLHILFKGPDESDDTRRLIEKAKALKSTLSLRQDSPAPEFPARYEALAWRALRSGRLSVGAFSRTMNLPRARVLRLLGEDEWNGEEIPIPSP